MRRESAGVSPSTAENYVSRVAGACLEYVLTLFPDIPDTWSASGPGPRHQNPSKYFYCIMDHHSRLMLALREFRTKGSSDLKELFRDAKELAGGIPRMPMSDAEASIAKAAKQTLRKSQDGTVSSAFHNAGAHIRGERTANRQERAGAPWPGGRAGTGLSAKPTAAARGA